MMFFVILSQSDNYFGQAAALSELKKQSESLWLKEVNSQSLQFVMRDNLQKISSQITTEYDVIVLEDLNIKGMIKNRRLAKQMGDAGWGMPGRMLEYKAKWNDKQGIKVNRFYPSSKTCSCGWKNHDLRLSDRNWTCPECQATQDSDLLAAINILKEGKRIIGTERSENTLRGPNKTSEKKHRSMKSEAHLS